MQYLKTSPSPHSGLNPEPTQTLIWPGTRAKRGLFYGVKDPKFREDELCVMLMDTWTDVGTLVKSQKQTMKHQNDAIGVLRAANTALAAQLNELREKHKNLSKAYRRSKYVELKPLIEDEKPSNPSSFNPLG